LPLPPAFGISAKTPPEAPKLPMNGATLFAKACQAEGLAAWVRARTRSAARRLWSTCPPC
jgi:hypothetical protein